MSQADFESLAVHRPELRPVLAFLGAWIENHPLVRFLDLRRLGAITPVRLGTDPRTWRRRWPFSSMWESFNGCMSRNSRWPLIGQRLPFACGDSANSSRPFGEAIRRYCRG